MTRKIAVLTTSRADYSHLYWPWRDLAAHPEVDLRIIVMGSHLSPEFGNTVQEIEKDGFRIDARIECLLSSDTDVGMAKTIGVATLSLADTLGQMRPDLLLLIADRYEMLAPASVALALRIPIAHIEGGEISAGAIDDAVRNAAHQDEPHPLHRNRSPPAAASSPWVKRSGACTAAALLRSTICGGRRCLHASSWNPGLELDLGQPTTWWSTTRSPCCGTPPRRRTRLFAALELLPEQILFCYPNADAGSRALIERTHAFLSRRRGRLFVNLDSLTYWSLLRQVDLLLGNSSSGIMETPSFALPTVNIGLRQEGRERARNILDCPPDAACDC